jgi:uncharacterized membrane protein YgcG
MGFSPRLKRWLLSRMGWSAYLPSTYVLPSRTRRNRRYSLYMGMPSHSLLVVSSVLAIVLLCPGASSAGEYEVSACTESVGYVNNSWHSFDSNSHYLEVHSGCNEEPTHELSANLSNLAVGDVLGAGDPPVGVEAGWAFAAPAGTTISEVNGSDDLFKDTDNSWGIYLKDAGGKILGGQTCIVELGNSFYCEVAGVFQGSGIATSSLAIGLACTENSFHNCPGGATVHDVRAGLDYATVGIRDELAPTGIVGSQIPSGSQHGTISILGSASDAAAGLLSLSVVNGANVVVGGPVSAPVPCDYSFATPCETEVKDLSIPVDTTKLPNGRNLIRVEATNAAHDEGFSDPYEITVENGGGGGSSQGGGGGTSGGGAGGSGGSTGGGAGATGTVQPKVGSPSGGSVSTPSNPGSVGALALQSAIFDLRVVRPTRQSIELSGRISKAATGKIALLASAHLKGSHIWTRDLSARISGGEFKARLRLPADIGRHTIAIRLTYPGDARYREATKALEIHALKRGVFVHHSKAVLR